ncbi:MAG: hypothetical protein K940chlam1_01293 [Candidatus Anoxychlamydiales bacterium]|nr:hypothetical protein [Candidatus Anoxychlamydiales bacterium]NGX35901.1 hypothetical protein [Candidatus Anoxychlamydiales bacterium]
MSYCVKPLIATSLVAAAGYASSSWSVAAATGFAFAAYEVINQCNKEQPRRGIFDHTYERQSSDRHDAERSSDSITRDPQESVRKTKAQLEQEMQEQLRVLQGGYEKRNAKFYATLEQKSAKVTALFAAMSVEIRALQDEMLNTPSEEFLNPAVVQKFADKGKEIRARYSIPDDNPVTPKIDMDKVRTEREAKTKELHELREARAKELQEQKEVRFEQFLKDVQFY